MHDDFACISLDPVHGFVSVGAYFFCADCVEWMLPIYVDTVMHHESQTINNRDEEVVWMTRGPQD